MAALCWMALFVLAASAASTATIPRPNIVFFLADDYGFGDIGYHSEMYGHDLNVVQTPHMNALAKDGVRLENYYVQPVCSPTRASLMTGRYVMHHGVHVPFIDSSLSALGLDEVTLADKMQEAGYYTAAIGKWHLGFRSWAHTPQERGFDEYVGYYAGSTDYWNHQSLCWSGNVKNGCFENTTQDGEAVTGLDLHRNRETIFNNTEYSTKFFTDEATRVIRERASTTSSAPLFLYLPYQAVHVGNIPTQMHPEYELDQAPERFIELYPDVQDIQRRNLSAMISAMDEAVKNVTDALKEAGMWDNTLFIFSTDNGGPVNDKASNYPLKGGKSSLWEGGVRGVGFVASGSYENLGIKTNATVNSQMIHVTDWLPTLCHLAGCGLNGTKPLDGVNVWDAIASDAASPRTVIVHDVCFNWMGGSCVGEHKAAVRHGNFKLVMGQDATTELYDLSKDPGETTDIKDQHPNELAAIMQLVAQYNASASPAIDRMPIDPRSNPKLHGGQWLPWMES